MITVEVRVHGNLRRFLPQGESRRNIELPDSARVNDLIHLLGATHEVGVIAIAGQAVTPRASLSEGTVIDLYPHIEGG